ncbi:hypothetical protein [Candidatus Nitrotoga sp. HW29]|uniref:hypothetical protein n=1 Tax=Candidatus Nitrotoga sp. HW29 TaxID=2886963 RepID=UPI001EF328CD|nr:hypothetical protein [Candidatus Nitrotoga sp. HW29]
MQYVQNLPLSPPLKGLDDTQEVTKLTEIKPVKPALEHIQPSLVFRPFTRSEHPKNPSFERRNVEPHLGERRKICRRIKTQPLLKELRSKVDRRHRKQRKTDITEHIDENA